MTAATSRRVIPAPEPPPTWLEQNLPVAATVISNGDETSALIMPATGLGAGTYSLSLALQRSRWVTTTSDPQAYSDAATIPLVW